MLTLGALDKTFHLYWDDMERCRAKNAYWSLLHVTVCLPDICAALETGNGRTDKKNRELYIAWCNTNLPDEMLTGAERYEMRCKVLHEGRAHIGRPDRRYRGFAFTQPAANGQVDHRRVDGTKLVLDVGQLSEEYPDGCTKLDPERRGPTRWPHCDERREEPQDPRAGQPPTYADTAGPHGHDEQPNELSPKHPSGVQPVCRFLNRVTCPLRGLPTDFAVANAPSADRRSSSRTMS